MRNSAKPVRKCHPCPLNQGTHCWLYKYPRGRWQDGKRCPAFSDEEIHREFRQWLKQPTTRTARDLRRGFFRARREQEYVTTPGRKVLQRRQRQKSRGA